MDRAYRVLAVLGVLGLGACAGHQPVRLAGPLDAMARAPRPALRTALGGCTMPVLDNPVLASMLVDATMGGAEPHLAASAMACQRRRTI